MPLYICVILQKSSVLKIADFEGENLPAAVAQAKRLCRLWPQSTRYELWSNGVKLHSAEPGNGS